MCFLTKQPEEADALQLLVREEGWDEDGISSKILIGKITFIIRQIFKIFRSWTVSAGRRTDVENFNGQIVYLEVRD